MSQELPKTIIEDVGQAQVEAEQVKKLAGKEIDQEWSKLKLAQALGLDDKVKQGQWAIERLLREADRKMEDGQWTDLLNALFTEPGIFFSNPDGFKEYAENKFGEGKRAGESGVENVDIGDTGYALQFFSDNMNVKLIPLKK